MECVLFGRQGEGCTGGKRSGSRGGEVKEERRRRLREGVMG